MHRNPIRHSIGPQDVLIVEGVPALLVAALRESAQLQVYIDVPESERLRRLHADYGWRGLSPAAVEQLAARATDEHQGVAASRVFADHVIASGASA